MRGGLCRGGEGIKWAEGGGLGPFYVRLAGVFE